MDDSYPLYELMVEHAVLGERPTADDWPPIYSSWTPAGDLTRRACWQRVPRRAPTVRGCRAARPTRSGLNDRSVPDARSRTVRVTMTRPSPASARARDAICTAMPRTSPSFWTSTSPVWMPARTFRSTAASAVRQAKGAAQRARRRVERGQDAIAGRFHVLTVPAGDLGPGHLVVAIQDLPPPPVAEGGRTLAGADDVGEQHSRQDAVHVLGCMERADLLIGPLVLGKRQYALRLLSLGS